jgi:hypothetical protein
MKRPSTGPRRLVAQATFLPPDLAGHGSRVCHVFSSQKMKTHREQGMKFAAQTVGLEGGISCKSTLKLALVS